MLDAGAAAVRPILSRRRRPSASAFFSPSKPGNSKSNDDAGHAAAPAHKPKTKAKTVASRYLSPSSSKPASISSSSSTSSSSTSTTTSSRRSASPAPRWPASAAERSRPGPPNAGTAAASGSATATTTRTLSVAFQSPSYSLDTSKARLVPPAAVTAITPEKRSSAVRWPASANAALCRFHSGSLTKSLDCGLNKKERPAVFAAVRSVAFKEKPRRASVDGAEHLQALSSDTESASSAGSQDGGGAGIASGARPSPRSIMCSSARFLRDAVGSRSDRFVDQVTPVLSSTSGVASSSPGTAPVKKKSLFNGLLSSPFSKPSLRQPTVIKPAVSLPRRMASPSPVIGSPAGVPGLAVKMQGKGSADCNVDGDTRRKAPGVSKAEDEHQLRILHNRHLQWRRANAQAGAALSAQTRGAEEHLCGAWIAIVGMRTSVALRKLQLQLFHSNCKLMAILRGQMIYLEEWSLLEKKHANTLSGTVEALNATILRLPVSDGAVADIQAIKNAVGTAIDVMQTIGNSTSTLMSKLARTNVLVSYLSRIAIQEHVLMTQCRELMSTQTSMHVKYSSLQGQRIQLTREGQGVSSLKFSEFRLLSPTSCGW